MTSFPRWRTALGLVWLAGAGEAAAQAPAYFAALAVPPSTVGTCMPVRTPAAAVRSDSSLRGRRLVMTARTPAGHRELTVYVDARGRVRHLSDMVSRGTGRGASTGESVVASVTNTGEVQGMLLRTNIVMEPPRRGAPLDSTALRVMRERVKTEQSRSALSERERAQVRVVAAWLVGRCPA